jgi:hypothetical protein
MNSVTCCVAVLLVAATAGARNYGFEGFCNFQRNGTAGYGLADCNQTVTGDVTDGRFPGTWPEFNAESAKGVMANGGVPQRGNLTLHLEAVRAGVEKRVPDVNFTGNIVIDFEAWQPNAPHGQYLAVSEQLIVDEHPHLANDTAKVKQLAKAAFEAAGLKFFVATIKLVVSLRPLAKAGYYGFPHIMWAGCQFAWKREPTKDCGYANPAVGPVYRKLNDRMKAVWAASSALFPNNYLYGKTVVDPADEPQVSNATYIAKELAVLRSTVVEARRLALAYTATNENPFGVPVVPFLWSLQTPNKARNAFPMSHGVLRGVLAASWLPPQSTQVVMWGDPRMPQQAAGNAASGPVLREAKTVAARCSAASCSGNGWCARLALTDGSDRSTRARTCVCGQGWTGATCNTTA